MEKLNFIIYAITLIACVFLSIFIYSKNRKAAMNRYFSLFLLAMAGWVITLYLFYESEQGTVLFIGRLNFVFTETLAFFGFYFGYYFPRKIIVIRKPFHVIFFLWLIFLTAITLFTDLIDKNEVIEEEKNIITKFGPLYYLFVIHVVALLIGMVVLPISKYKSAKLNREKQQIKYLTFGTALLIIFGITTNILMPFVFNNYSAQSLGPLWLFFLLGFTSYAIIKHQLLDIRVVIQKSLVYSAVLALIVGLYISLIFVLGFFFQQMTDMAVILAAGITTVVSIYGAPLIEKYFRRKTDRVFFKDKYDYSQAIYELSEILNRNIDLEILLKDFSARLKDILKVKSVNVVIPEKNLMSTENNGLVPIPEKIPANVIKEIEKEGEALLLLSEIGTMLTRAKAEHRSKDYFEALTQAEYFGKKYGFAATVAVLLDEKLEGLIMLGKKLSGDPFSAEDTKLLKTVAYQAAVALEKTRLFEQVKKYSGQLEKKVAARTAEIKGLQERQKQMMLEIGHGLQTPLTIIKGEISMLQREEGDRDKFSALEKSIDRISKFIYDMLRLARLESDAPRVKNEKIDLSELLRELIESFKIITEEKGIAIGSEIEDEIQIYGNRNELEELFMNLVSNSVKCLDEKRLQKIEIQLRRETDYAIATIADTGIGIGAEHLPLIFTRFYRINDGSRPDKRGTGLGLAISKEIVEHHGGRIEVQSRIGQGTKFTIRFPLVKRAA
jgi:signal transduction histidine kinase